MAVKGVRGRRGFVGGPDNLRVTVLDFDSGEHRLYDIDVTAVAVALGVNLADNVTVVGASPAKGVLVAMGDGFYGGAAWVKPSPVGEPVVTLPAEPVASSEHPTVFTVLADGTLVVGSTGSNARRLVRDGVFVPGEFEAYYYTPSGGSFGTEYVYNDFFVLAGALVGYGTRASFPAPINRSVSAGTSLAGPSGLTPDGARTADNSIASQSEGWLAGLAMLVGATPPQKVDGELGAVPVTAITGSAASATVVLHGQRWDGGIGVARQEATVSYVGGAISVASFPSIVGTVWEIPAENGLGVIEAFDATYDGDWPAVSGEAPSDSFWTGLVYSTVIP